SLRPARRPSTSPPFPYTTLFRSRDIAMVFQNYALYPHMSVRDNMGFALKMAGKSKDEIKKRVSEAAETLGLTEFLDRKPKALSGDRKSTRLNSSHVKISYAVFCL